MCFEEKTIRKEVVYDGKIIRVEKHEVELENKNSAIREVVKHNGAVAVLAIKDQHVLLIKQFRKAMEHQLIEIPAGKIEKGEERKTTALRELEEETGYSSHHIAHLYDFYTSPGFCNEKISLFLADDLFESNELKPDEDEDIRLEWVHFNKIDALLKSGKIEDAKTILALQYVLVYINSK